MKRRRVRPTLCRIGEFTNDWSPHSQSDNLAEIPLVLADEASQLYQGGDVTYHDG